MWCAKVRRRTLDFITKDLSHCLSTLLRAPLQAAKKSILTTDGSARRMRARARLMRFCWVVAALSTAARIVANAFQRLDTWRRVVLRKRKQAGDSMRRKDF